MAKEKSFIEYMRDWRKKKPIKLRADGTPIDDSGWTSGEIRISAPDPLKRKGKKKGRVHTRIKRAKPLEKGTPKKIYGGIKNAAPRRKGVTVEI